MFKFCRILKCNTVNKKEKAQNEDYVKLKKILLCW